jgi:hypothetical protein
MGIFPSLSLIRLSLSDISLSTELASSPLVSPGFSPIYYSLGNFIFDQYFNARVKNGLAVALTFSAVSSTPALVNVQEYPVVLKTDGRTCLVEEGK